MSAQEMEKYSARLRSTVPLVGGKLRRAACRKLAEMQAPEVVPILIGALNSEDDEVERIAGEALGSLAASEQVDALFAAVVRQPTPKLVSTALRNKLKPKSGSHRAVVSLLGGDVEAYLDIDFDYTFLKAEYKSGSAALRKMVTRIIRESGDARLLGLFESRMTEKLTSELDVAEAAVALDVYRANKQWQQIFNMLFLVPLLSVPKALAVLQESGWQPEHESEKVVQEELQKYSTNLGEVSAQLPGQEAALGPVFQEILKQGAGKTWTERSAEELRAVIKKESPEEAIAALKALVASGAATAEDAEAARRHRHWLVRLAALVLFELPMRLVFSAKAVPMQGGHLWLEKLVPLLQARSLYTQRALNLSPTDLNALQDWLPQARSDVAGKWGKLLEILARHHHRHTIEIDDSMTIELDARDIEMDFDE